MNWEVRILKYFKAITDASERQFLLILSKYAFAILMNSIIIVIQMCHIQVPTYPNLLQSEEANLFIRWQFNINKSNLADYTLQLTMGKTKAF